MWHGAHYDVIVMTIFCVLFVYQNSYESVKFLLPDAVLIVICDLLK